MKRKTRSENARNAEKIGFAIVKSIGDFVITNYGIFKTSTVYEFKISS